MKDFISSLERSELMNMNDDRFAFGIEQIMALPMDDVLSPKHLIHACILL